VWRGGILRRKPYMDLAALLLLILVMLAQPGASVSRPTGENVRGHAFSTSFSSGNQGSILEADEPVPLWNRTFGGIGNEYAYSMIQTSDNGFLLTGGTLSFGGGGSDFWLVKTDPSGNMQWNKTYGGIGDEEAHSVTRTLDGGYAILGRTDSFGSGGYDFWLVKTGSSGIMMWNKTYGGVGDDDGWSIEENPDGSLIVAGLSTSFGMGSGDFWLVKTDASGTMLWNKTYGGPLLDMASSVVKTADGGYALTGYTYSFGAGNSDFWLVKTDAFGVEQWNKTYGGANDDFGFSLLQTSDRGYALAGSTSSFGQGVYDFWFIRTDQYGNTVWNKTYGGIGYDEAWATLQVSDYRFVLAGWTESFGAGNSDCWLIATDASGNPQWNVTWGGAENDYAYSVLQCNDGNFALVGETRSFGAVGSDFLLVKFSGVANVAITNVTTLKNVVGQGYTTNISVMATNEGDFTETFNVTVRVNVTSVASQTLTLTSGESRTMLFVWDTSSFAKGNYTLSAYAWPVQGEADTADNNFTEGWIMVSIVGDVNGDGKVDGKDLGSVAWCFGSYPGAHPPMSWDPNCDTNNDGKVDGKDLGIVAWHFGEPHP